MLPALWQMNPSNHPRAIEFAIAYRRYLDRHGDVAKNERTEPRADHFGLTNELAERLRLEVYQDKQRDVMAKSIARKHFSIG